MIKSIIYVSHAAISECDRAVSISKILNTARVQNSRFGITGALISSKSMFAQIIEGPPESVDALMGLLGRDVRHNEVKVALSERKAARQFADWSMAYQGETPYIEKHLQAMSGDSSGSVGQARVHQLVELMVQLRKRLS